MVNIPPPPKKKKSKRLGAISPNDAQTFQINGVFTDCVCPISTLKRTSIRISACTIVLNNSHLI